MFAGFEDGRSRNGCERYRGEGTNPLEVIVVACDEQPTEEFLREAHPDRRGGRTNPVLVVALYNGSAGLCGPDGGVYRADRGRAERVCEAALDRPDRHDAREFLDRELPRLDGGLAGLHNRGLLSTREPRVGVPERDDWDEAAVRGRRVLASDPARSCGGWDTTSTGVAS